MGIQRVGRALYLSKFKWNINGFPGIPYIFIKLFRAFQAAEFLRHELLAVGAPFGHVGMKLKWMPSNVDIEIRPGGQRFL